MKKLILTAIFTITLTSTTYAKAPTTVTCEAKVTAKNEVTFYDAYDGNIYDADTTGFKIGDIVLCTIDTKGTKTIYDDDIIKVEIFK